MLIKKLVIFFLTIWMMLTFFSVNSMAMGKFKKVYILFNGIFSIQHQLGDNNDYTAGVNDFPVTPTHKEFGLGCGLMINFSEKLAAQLVGDYLFGTEVEKEDPSDGEIVMYRTYNNINVMGSMILKFGRKNQFFTSGGGGINFINPYDDKELEGSLGSLIIISAPESKINPMISFGGGVILKMPKAILKFEAAYTLTFKTKKKSILLRLGIGF
jgi:hypothetical protein